MRTTSTTKTVSRQKPTKDRILQLQSVDNYFHSINSRTSSRKSSSVSSPVCNPPVFHSAIDGGSNACVFKCGREFLVDTVEQTEDKTVTVLEKHSTEHPMEGVPIKTIAAVADTAAGCQVVLLFHNVAHAESNDTTITLSRDQMKKGGVHCNLVNVDQVQRENNGVV